MVIIAYFNRNRYIRSVFITKGWSLTSPNGNLKMIGARHRSEQEGIMMRAVKRAYDLESFELDNIYNEEEERYTRVESSIWYN